MTALPATIRINMPVPFPAQVVGTGVVKLSKQFGVWTVSLDFTQLQPPAPIQLTDFPNTYFLVWNSVTGVYNLSSLAFMASLINPIPTLVSVTPYNVLPTDTLLLVDTSIGPVTINLQPAAARQGAALGIKDSTGHALANPISVVPIGGETVDGLAPYPMTGDYIGVKFAPVATGYAVAP